MPKGQLFIVSGPSGSGKDTVLSKLFQRHPELRLSISSITRAMRQGEKEGEKYHFISKEEFLDGLEKDLFLEHNEYMGNFYGTPKEPVERCIENGEDMILEIDVNGAAAVKKLMPQAVSVFIMPPSFAELSRRLSGRGTESAEAVKGRLDASLREITQAVNYDYIVVNDDLDEAVNELSSIIVGERCRIDRKEYLINEVLENVESCDW